MLNKILLITVGVLTIFSFGLMVYALWIKPLIKINKYECIASDLELEQLICAESQGKCSRCEKRRIKK